MTAIVDFKGAASSVKILVISVIRVIFGKDPIFGGLHERDKDYLISAINAVFVLDFDGIDVRTISFCSKRSERICQTST